MLVRSGGGAGGDGQWRPAWGGRPAGGLPGRGGKARHTGVRTVPLLHALPQHISPK